MRKLRELLFARARVSKGGVDKRQPQKKINYKRCLKEMDKIADKYWSEEEEENEGRECWEDEDWVEDDSLNGTWDESDPEAQALKRREKELWAKCMRIACAQAVREEYENRPAEFAEHKFSRRFNAKMDRIIHAERLVEKKPELSSILCLFRPVRSKRMAVVMAAVLVLVFGTTVGGTNPVIVWMCENWIQQHGDYVELESREYGNDVTDGEFQKYELADVPEGYKLEYEKFFENLGFYQMYYTNEKGQALIFEQGRKDNGNLGNVTADREDLEEVEIGEFEGYYFKDADTKNMVLSDEEYTLLFIGDFSKEEFRELAENLHVIE